MWLLNDTSFTKWRNSGDGDNLWTFTSTQANIEAGTNTPTRAKRALKFKTGKAYKITVWYSLGDGVLTLLRAFIGNQAVTIGSSVAETSSGIIEVIFTSNVDAEFFEIQANSDTNLSTLVITDVRIEDFNQSSFLTKFTRPKMWDGYQFLLSAAVGDVEDDLILTLKGYNGAGTLLATNQSTAAAFTDKVVNFNVSEVYGELTNVKYITAYVESATGEILTDTITIDVEQPCANPIYLMGRNSLGGVIQWMFDVNQEETFDYANDIKAQRQTLFATNLTDNQWTAIQDFITLGQTYRNNIAEFTSANIKTSTRIGQQIYTVDTEGNKIGVIALPTQNSTLTKQVKHFFTLEIEYPEAFAV
jgi:hypothetical protein